MEKLQIGDFVISGDGKYTQVYGFGHWDPNHEETFIQIEFDGGDGTTMPLNKVHISPMHLVFVTRNNNRMDLIRAVDVIIGDVLTGSKQVTAIHRIIQKGVYTPLTQSGDIVVNGIVASNYVDVLHWNHPLVISMQHTMGHMIMSPQRCFCHYYIAICQKERYIQGYSYWAYLIVSVSLIFQNGFFLLENPILIMVGLLAFVSTCVWMLRRVNMSLDVQAKLF
jgi:Hint module